MMGRTVDITMKSGAVLFLVLLATVSADNDALQKRVERLEQRYELEIAKVKDEYGNKIIELELNVAGLKRTSEECDSKITQLEQRIVNLERTNIQLASENAVNKEKIDTLEKTTDDRKHGHGSRMEKENAANSIRTKSWKSAQKTVAETTKMRHNRQTRAVSDGDGLNIAFTAYVDHDLDSQGRYQSLVFNKVLLNHGSGYNNYTGVFTAPVAGVYSFTFFVGQRDNNQFFVQLVVNNKHMLDAVVETSHTTQDLQGGNTGNLLLAKGDSVSIRHNDGVGSHLEGSNRLRITSFSGFLIYPVEASIIVGK